MPVFGLPIRAVYLLFGLVGLGLVVAGAWSGIRLPRQRVEAPLTAQQRILCTVLGLLLIGIAWAFLTGRLPQQQ